MLPRLEPKPPRVSGAKAGRLPITPVEEISFKQSTWTDASLDPPVKPKRKSASTSSLFRDVRVEYREGDGLFDVKETLGRVYFPKLDDAARARGLLPPTVETIDTETASRCAFPPSSRCS